MTALLAVAITAPRADAAPGPGESRNLEVDPDARPSVVRTAARVLLFVPRWTFRAVMWPVREGLYAVDRYDVLGRVGRLLSGDSPITLYPSLKLEAGFGLTYGIGVGVRDHLRGTFLFGGEVRQVYGVKVRSRDLLGERFEVDAEVELQLLNDSRFDGIGNQGLVAGVTGIDALADPTAVATFYDQDIFRAELGAVIRPLPRRLRVRLSAAHLRRNFDQPSSGLSVTDVYQRDSLVTFEDGLSQVYGEVRVIYDDRRQPFPLVSSALPTTGDLITGFVGRAEGLAGDPSSYFRLGFNAQHYLHLFGGDRVLIGRLNLEGVTGDLDELPFVDLPQLGGSTILRGYRRGRFRDRISALGSLEYRYPLHRLVGAFLFFDAGGVYRDLGAVDLTDVHAGGGGGLLVYTGNRFLFRVQAGYGEDGLVLNASLKPSSRVRRATRRK